MMNRVWLRALGFGVLAAFTVGCSSDASSISSDGGSGSTPSTSAVVELADSELAAILAVAVPAAIEANPDGAGEIVASDYTIADSLGSVSGESVTFPGNETPLSRGVRDAISTAVSPGSAVFVPADLTKAMLLLGTPAVADDSVIVTYEQRCGGDPDALCGSGGAFRMERGVDGWQVSEVLSGWIS
jgi:hypothetical protein